MSMNGIASVRIIDSATIERERRLSRVVELARKLLDIREGMAWGESTRVMGERDCVYSEIATELALLRSK